MKREDVLSWDEYFMGVALLSAKRSKDPNTQCGACIVNRSKRIVGIGYNGFPSGIKDDVFPWDREGDFLETKYAYVVHAEVNAVMNATSNLKGCTMYVDLFPCNECTKVIIQAGIREVVYLDDKYWDKPFTVAAKNLLYAAGVYRRKIEIDREKLWRP
jgi:dCMP deaminase